MIRPIFWVIAIMYAAISLTIMGVFTDLPVKGRLYIVFATIILTLPIVLHYISILEGVWYSVWNEKKL